MLPTKGPGAGAGGSGAARFLREKGCFVTLQVVILVLCAQAALRYGGMALASSSSLSLSGAGGGAAGGAAPLGFFARTRGAFRAVAGSDRPLSALFGALQRSAASAASAPAGAASAAAAASASGDRGGRRRHRSGGAARAPVENSIFEPQCAPTEERFRGLPAPVVDVAIASECNSRSRRDAVRKGWGSFAKTLGIRYRFFVGQTLNDKHCDASLGAEMRRFDDIVVLPLIDTYGNLTQKVMGMMTYTARCSSGLFYAKCDDDVFVYAWRLQERLKALLNDTDVAAYSLGIYMGNFWIDSKPIKEDWHKNHESRYVGGYFPPYAGGPFYVLSRAGVEFVLDNSRRLNHKWRNEDMAVGTWFTGADVKIIQEWKIKLLNWKHHEKPYIAEHCVDAEDGVEAWHGVLHANFSQVGI